MPEEVIDFINSQFLSVLSVEMMDGSPHGATVHFAFSNSPLLFLFETHRSYRKCEALFGRPASRASLVIGFNENNRKTLQMDGEVRLMEEDSERIMFNRIYFKKFPKKKEKYQDSSFVFFSFTPLWWRYTDWEHPGGKRILSSENSKPQEQ